MFTFTFNSGTAPASRPLHPADAIPQQHPGQPSGNAAEYHHTSGFRASSWGPWLALAVLASRLPWLPRWLEDHDSVNFALGLARFDLAEHRPHFPGYPVYLALAALVRTFGATDAVALALPAMLAAAAATWAVFAVLRPRVGAGGALAAAVLYALLPGPWLADATPLSDGLGVHAVTLLLCGALAAPGSLRVLLVTALACGLLPGVRASLLAMALAVLIWLLVQGQGRRLAALAASAAGVLAWLLPLAVLAGGPSALLDIGFSFVDGHFHDWGHTAFTDAGNGPAVVWPQRLAAFAGNLLHYALGPVAVAALLVSAAGLWFQAPADRKPWILLAMALPYALWVALGQNPDKPRHVLPLLPPLLLAVAHGLPGLVTLAQRLRLPALGRLAFAAAMVLAAVAVPRLAVRATEPPPGLQLARWLASVPPEQTQVYSGAETRLLRLEAPGHRSTRVRSLAEMQTDLTTRGNRPQRLLVTSGVPGLPQDGTFRLVARFPPRAGVDGPGAGLVLHAWTPQPRVVVAARAPIEVVP